MTRGELRPVHITLIATCRVYFQAVILTVTPGPTRRYEDPTPVESSVLSVSRDLGGVCPTTCADVSRSRSTPAATSRVNLQVQPIRLFKDARLNQPLSFI